MKYPFEATEEEISAAPEDFVSSVCSTLASEFLVMPKGEGYIEYAAFESGYEALKHATNGFQRLVPEQVFATVLQAPVSLIVLRAMLGFTPPEWAYVAGLRTGIPVPQNAARTLDREVRVVTEFPWRLSETNKARVKALVETACAMLEEGCPPVPGDKLHRLHKADTNGGLPGIRNLTGMGAPYAMLLYERFLGRPFAGHRDSVSDLIGDNLESAIEEMLARDGISFRKTRRAERLAGFAQAPDFIIPDEFSPRVIIEAKITEDDGTARDKVTRILRLCQMAADRKASGLPGYQVIACIAGRGFGVRRADMRQLILHTKGKVFTPKTMDRLVECSALREFRSAK
ncbi:MAG: hypothetical protein NTW21_19125 [Verrucomicrobia bacterium]|nr:hypothetical protein [Verrucomicrobiota bacterium]